MKALIGAAISTTGDPHRIGMLEASARAWRKALDPGLLVVTVDGDSEACARAVEAVAEYTPHVYRVGRPAYPGDMDNQHRLGVAVNKNTGLELLMTYTYSQHLFLCDDDTWPLYPESLAKHIDLPLPHSMVCWGKHRLGHTGGPTASWTWPRGVLLYVNRKVVETVGGMDERFGPGGHEHVEYSRRIHNAKFTPAPFISPASYATRDGMGARALWHAEDMPLVHEPRHVFQQRKAANTSIQRVDGDWDKIDQVMWEREGSAEFVPYAAAENGRASATLCTSSTRA